MRQLERAGVLLQWEAEGRLFSMSFVKRARPSAEDARVAQAWVEERAAGGPIRLMVDFANLDPVALTWRYRWLVWGFRHSSRIQAASVNADREGLAIARTFAKGTRIRYRHFSSEVDARAWLLSNVPDTN